MMDPNYLYYAWIDLETTGIKPGGILEVCCIVTDNKMNVIEELETTVSPGQEALNSMDDFVRNMHTINGLLNRIPGAPSTIEVETVWADMLSRINNGDPQRILMVGNSIGSLDMPFIRTCMPKVAAQMHYRSIDITSVRLFAGMMLGADVEFEKKTAHRAKDDVLECQAETDYLWKFITGPQTLRMSK